LGGGYGTLPGGWNKPWGLEQSLTGGVTSWGCSKADGDNNQNLIRHCKHFVEVTGSKVA